jgi:hypothetical protein
VGTWALDFVAAGGYDELGAIAETHYVVLARVIGLPQVDTRAFHRIAAGVVNLAGNAQGESGIARFA